MTAPFIPASQHHNGNHSVAVTVTVLDAADTPCAEFSADMVLMKKKADAADPIGNR